MDFVSEDEVAAFRRSGQFDEDWYVAQYPDVEMLGIDPATHYLWLGRSLGREPKASFSKDVREEARRQIIRSLDGQSPLTNSLCLFSHFDIHGEVDDYVVDYVRGLAECGLSTIFITTCEQISDRELSKVRPFVTKSIVKRNIGRDFGAWFTGIVDTWTPGAFRRVVLANDSVYGPLFDLKDIFEDMGGRSLDLWGITDSFETAYHLQTYFVVLEDSFVNSQTFAEFWNAYQFEANKRKVIDNFEIGLTVLAQKNGFRVGALCSYFDVRRQALKMVDHSKGIGRAALQSRLTPVNSSHFFWRALLQNFQCPFLKIELLRDNPSNIDDVSMWARTVSDNSNFEIGSINRHLARVRTTMSNI